MAMSSRQRWVVIIAALLATLAAMAWLESVENDAQNQNAEDPAVMDAAVMDSKAGQQKHRPGSRSDAHAPNPPVAADARTSGQGRNASADTQGDGAVLPDLSLRQQTLAADDDQHVDLFKAHAWYVPPPPPKPVAIQPENLPPPKPVAPPVPFTYMGKLEDGPQGSLIFLVQKEKVVQAKIGQTLDRVWKLEREDANALHFTYLPLNMTKTLSKATRTAPATGAAAQNRMPAVAPVPPLPEGSSMPADGFSSEPTLLIPTN